MANKLSFFEDTDYLDEEAKNYLDESFRVLQEKNIVRMDKKTVKKKMMTRATLMAAKAANDQLYVKYVKYTKLRKQFRELIEAKYAAKGKALAKAWLNAPKDE